MDQALRIHLCGAAGEVTGSGYLVEHGGSRVLVDFGLFQGTADAWERNHDLGPVVSRPPDAVLLTHAHLDHAGRMPMLLRTHAGGSGRRCGGRDDGDGSAPALGHHRRWRLLATAATLELAEVILEDAARIQEADAEHAMRHADRGASEHRGSGRSSDGSGPREAVAAHRATESVEPLFTPDDVPQLMRRGRAVRFGEWLEVLPGWQARWRNSGHILGAASIELRVGGRRIAFSGDIGPRGLPILNDPDPPTDADLVFLESTYGDRDHRPFDATLREFAEIIRQAAWGKAKVIIPAFAIGRTQLILECLAMMRQDVTLPRVPIWLDSPMATKANEVYERHRALMNPPAQAWRRSGDLAEALAELRIIRTSDESRALNDHWEPGIIIAGSGMCDGGRILHHLKHNLWKRGVHVVLCGYMSRGTLGWQLLSGAREVRVLGGIVPVRATVHTLGGFSAHAGQSELLEWLAPMATDSRPEDGPVRERPWPLRVVLVHGEERPREVLASRIHARFGLDAERPERGAVIDA